MDVAVIGIESIVAPTTLCFHGYTLSDVAENKNKMYLGNLSPASSLDPRNDLSNCHTTTRLNLLAILTTQSPGGLATRMSIIISTRAIPSITYLQELSAHEYSNPFIR